MEQSKDITAGLAALRINDTATRGISSFPASGEDALTSAAATTNTYPKALTLNVGGRKFQTSLDTLRLESGLFRIQFSDRYSWTPEPDGSYFLDADAELFAHLLRFMRRPAVFPLFYTAANGFDYDLYNRLEAEAWYFRIDLLHKWIKEKTYLQAVKIQTGNPVTRNINQIAPTSYPGNKTEEWYVVARTRKVYLCPRQVSVHRGRPDLCGAACHKRQAENSVEYDEEAFLEVVSVEKEIVFDDTVCRVE